MKNILSQKPTIEFNARLTESVSFVVDEDIRDKTVLDIGCGYGWFENNALMREVEDIYGIEITEGDLDTVKQNITDKRAHFEVAGALQLPFGDHMFDTVVSWEVIEHIPRMTEPQMFDEIARVIKPGGHFYLSTPYNSIPSKILDPAWWLIGHRHYSSKALEEYGGKAGFKAVSVRTKGGYWCLASSLNMYISKWIFRRPPFFAKRFLRHEFEEYKAPNGIATIFVKYEKSEVEE